MYSNHVSQLIKALITSSEDSDERAALIRHIRQELYDPRMIERIPFLHAGHPIAREALTVSDAFEAVTNGMDNPEAFEELESIGMDSIVYPWKLLIYAIRAFYENKPGIMKEYLDRIPHDVPPAVIVPILTDMSSRKEAANDYSDSERKLYRDIMPDNTILRHCVEQLEEAAAAGLEDVFIDTVIMIVKDVMRTDKKLSEQFTILCLQLSVDHDFSTAELMARLKTVYPQALVYRLTALSMMASDPDIALLFWIRFLLARLHLKDIDAAETEAALGILAELYNGAQEIIEQEGIQDTDYHENLDGLIGQLRIELDTIFPGLFRLQTLSNLYNSRIEPDGEKLPTEIREKKAPRGRKKQRHIPSIVPEQLELFV